MTDPRRRFSPILLLICFIAPLSIAAETKGRVSDWLKTPQATPYASIASELLESARRADDAGIPQILLVERLDEGALKAVPPPLLARAIGLDLERFNAVAKLLATLRNPPRAEDSPALLRQGAILLRAGYGEDELAAIFEAARAPGEARGDLGGQIAARALRAAAVALDASLRFGLGPDTREALGAALASSALPSPRLDAILSLLAKAKGMRIQPEAAATILIENLKKGASLETLEREITRRAVR